MPAGESERWVAAVTDPTQKLLLRRAALARLTLAPAVPAEAQAIAARVLALPQFRAARRVCLYVALAGEPGAEALWAAAGDRSIVCPGGGSNGPELRAVRELSGMARAGRGFWEPPPGEPVPPSDIDVFVVPGLSFDGQGVRLGRGGGYYDRLLAQRAQGAVCVGVALERWLTLALPREPHDVPVTHLATEARLFAVAP